MVQIDSKSRPLSSNRLPWNDRFSKPEVDQLSAHYDGSACALFDSARKNVSQSESVEERLAWQGLPWRWTLVFEHPSDPTRAFAYLVPDPATPKISVPLTPEMIQRLPLKRMKKTIRDGIETGNRINSVIWACWDIGSENQLDEILDIVNCKLAYIEEQGPASNSR